MIDVDVFVFLIIFVEFLSDEIGVFVLIDDDIVVVIGGYLR